jgi:hypothetical protein
MAEEALLEQVLGAAAGSARMAAAATEDVVGLRRHPDDWLDAWDPAYIRTTLPALRAMSKLYFRAEVRGLSNIPAEGPILLVGNHSGGTLIADTFVFAQAFYDHFSPLRRFHQLAHDLVFKLPGARASLSRYGTVPASPENMTRALEREAALLVYPGGDHETYRPSWESGTIDFAGRRGFAKLAIEHNCSIEGLPGPGCAAVRADDHGPPGSGAAPGQDRDPRAAEDRPQGAPREQARRRRRLRDRHGHHAARAGQA